MNQPPNRNQSRNRSETIVAIATPPGRGGIGIVRLSGSGLAPVVLALMGRTPEPRQATHGAFLDASGAALDDGLALYFPGPASYTGEDVLELHGHGSPVVMHMLIKRCVELGARLAEPGEFTRRAFLNDKLDLAQAESVADLIEAATETAVRCALRSLRGDFSKAVDAMVQQLVDLRMLVEATLDFPDEEIDPMDRAAMEQRLARVRAELARALESGRQGSLLRSGLQVVLAGQPNVGKSSLLNRLAGEDLAIVTPIPGTTRDTVRQVMQIEGVPLHIIDTAGLRETTDEVEALGIARTWAAIESADLLILIVDAARGVTAEEQAIIERLPQGLRRLTVYNKTDLLQQSPRVQGGDHGPEIHLSAKTGAGLDLLKAEILHIAGWRPGNEDLLMARERHLSALSEAASALECADRMLAQTEFFAEELRFAQASLSSITGTFTADDLLGEIFSRFCIGK